MGFTAAQLKAAMGKGLVVGAGRGRAAGCAPITDLKLPYPPTINTYWRRVGHKTLLSERARKYRGLVLEVMARLKFAPHLGDVEVAIIFRPPDRRTRDLDNLPKGLLDALKYAGVYADDSQVRHIDMRFGGVVKGGCCYVTVRSMVK